MNLTKNFIATAADGLYSDSGSKGLYLREMSALRRVADAVLGERLLAA